jgi:hypothetical protein
VTADILFATAEVAIALAGFSAIVAIFKRNSEGMWQKQDADRFNGMVLHAVSAVVFSFLPYLLYVIIQDVVTAIHFSSVMLGVQLVGHSLIVIRLGTTGRGGSYAMGAFGVLVGLLQLTVFTDWAAHREMDIYLAGIIWHILQAGLLFILLIWIPKSRIE